MSTESIIPAGERSLNGLLFKLSKSDDELKLFAEVLVPEEFNPDSIHASQLEEVFADIPKAHLSLELLMEALRHAQPNSTLESRRIAKGTAPIHGRNGKLLLLVKPFRGDFRAGELERVDPRYVRAFDNIEVGTVVARILEPTLGTPGSSCFGSPLPPMPGKPAQVDYDPSSLLQRQDIGYQSIVAKSSGYLSVAGNKLQVEHTLNIKGDVSFQTGDIDFIGAITVAGTVKKDFTVQCNDDVQVKGGVSGGSVISKKGSVIIAESVIGDLVSVIRSGGSVLYSGQNRRSEIFAKIELRAKSLENVYVETGGDLIVEREIRKCSIVCRGAIRLPKGAIIGGELKAVCGIEAETFGNTAGSQGDLKLLSDIESSAEFLALRERIQKHYQAEEALELHLGPLVTTPGRVQLAPEGVRLKLKKLLREREQVKKSREALELELQSLLSGAHFNRALRVNVLGVLYPGVTISVGKARFSV